MLNCTRISLINNVYIDEKDSYDDLVWLVYPNNIAVHLY